MKTALNATFLTLCLVAAAGCETFLDRTTGAASALDQAERPALAYSDKTTVLEAVIEPSLADKMAKESLATIASAIAAGDVTSEAMVEAYL
ncbi:MAG: hypothetical protein AAFS13_02550, partial [Pseudomonadota bacterium]